MLLGNIGMKHKKYKDALGEYNKSLEISQFQSSEKNIARAQQGFLDAICAGAGNNCLVQFYSARNVNPWSTDVDCSRHSVFLLAPA